MLNTELRLQGIGASEVAAILGMDPRRDAFSVWARKLELIDEPDNNIRMRKGKYFERGIIDWYSDETGFHTVWSDTTMRNGSRPWQVVTPDAFVYETNHGVPVNSETTPQYQGGVDAKLVNFDQRGLWGEDASGAPDHYAIQCQWTCSALEKPWWDIAAAIGDELRIYRIHRDPAIETVLLEVVDKFWKENVLGRTQPPIGMTDAATAYLKKQFPKNVEAMRAATPEEGELMAKFKQASEAWDVMEKVYTPLENELKLAIGDAEGLIHGDWKVTYKKDKDSTGTDWRAVAHRLGEYLEGVRRFANDPKLLTQVIAAMPTSIEALEAQHQITTRIGPRKLRPTWGKKGK